MLFRRAVRPPTSGHLLAFNVATVSLVDEFLCIPSGSAAAAAIEHLYGRDVVVPPAFLERVGTGARVPLASVLPSAEPLASLLTGQLKPSSAWHEPTHVFKGARALARDRYRDLQASLVACSARVIPDPLASLVRYTYGIEGWPGSGRTGGSSFRSCWLWSEVARRLLDAVVALNRCALGLLASIARGETILDIGVPVTGSRWSFDLPAATLDVLAEVLPPTAVPDFPTFVRVLETRQARIEPDEALAHYRSLFAEMLGLATHSEVFA